MANKLRIIVFAGFLLLLPLLVSGSAYEQESPQRGKPPVFIEYDAIIQNGIHTIDINRNSGEQITDSLIQLERWYNRQPLIEYASLVGSSITVKFIDGFYTVILDTGLGKNHLSTEQSHRFYQGLPDSAEQSNSALVLNPAEYMYGHRQCQRIITTLLHHDYSIEYLSNQAVDLPFVKTNLSADIVYMNTHAGYFDVDGDYQADAVVIATGEFWTNDTEQKYAFDYQNKLIVKGMVGDQGIVAFTPAFIEHYYSSDGFPDSLVFMATCYALCDSSMAQAFLNTGADVYMGWSQNTVFWTNSIVSVHAFRLLSMGFSVQQVCSLIRSGGFYNWLFHSRLSYFGDGTYRILRLPLFYPEKGSHQKLGFLWER
jgi:hypothetical protein